MKDRRTERKEEGIEVRSWVRKENVYNKKYKVKDKSVPRESIQAISSLMFLLLLRSRENALVSIGSKIQLHSLDTRIMS